MIHIRNFPHCEEVQSFPYLPGVVDVCFLVAGVCDCYRQIDRPEHIWYVEKVLWQPVDHEVVRILGSYSDLELLV